MGEGRVAALANVDTEVVVYPVMVEVERKDADMVVMILVEVLAAVEGPVKVLIQPSFSLASYRSGPRRLTLESSSVTVGVFAVCTSSCAVAHVCHCAWVGCLFRVY